MICSPCKRCIKRKMPKNFCIENCEKIRDLQRFQLTNNEDIRSYSIDYYNEISVRVNI